MDKLTFTQLCAYFVLTEHVEFAKSVLVGRWRDFASTEIFEEVCYHPHLDALGIHPSTYANIVLRVAKSQMLEQFK